MIIQSELKSTKTNTFNYNKIVQKIFLEAVKRY